MSKGVSMHMTIKFQKYNKLHKFKNCKFKGLNKK